MLNSKDNSAHAISLNTNVGPDETIAITNVQGTAENALSLTSISGGVDVDAAPGKDISLTGGQVLLNAIDNAASAISIRTNAGTNETIAITNVQGTSDEAIKLTAASGGLVVNAQGDIAMDSQSDVAIQAQGEMNLDPIGNLAFGPMAVASTK